MTRPSPARRAHLLFAVLLVLAAGVLCWDIGEPWVGRHEGWNGAVWSLAARAHVEYGLGATRLGAVTNGDHDRPADFVYYADHPPLLPLAVAGAFALLGEHEWAARLLSVLASLGSLVLVYLIGRELGGAPLALLAAFVFAFLPMSAFYGRMVDHEAPTGFLALLAVLLYLRWRASRRGGWLAASLAVLALGMGFGWPAYYLAGLLPLHHLLVPDGGRRDWRVLAFPAVALAAFALFLAHVWLLRGGDGLRELAAMFATRTGAGTADYHEGPAERFTWLGFLWLWAKRGAGLFTLPALLAAALGLASLGRDGGGRPGARSVPLLLLAFGLIHVLLFRQGAWVHEYWAFYLSAPLALLAARGVLWLTRGVPSGRVALLFAALFLAAAVPRLLALHRADDARVLDECRLVAAHARPGEVVCMSAGLVKPQVAYYARRDVREAPVRSAVDLAGAVAAGRPVALFVLEGGPGASELQTWLAPRATPEEDVRAGGRYLVFHLPGAR